MKQSRKVHLFLAILAFFALFTLLTFFTPLAAEGTKLPRIEIYVLDMTGACTANEVSCKEEILLNETNNEYKGLLKAAGLDHLPMQVYNIRYPSVMAKLEDQKDELKDYLNKPYPLIFIDGVFEKNMVRSPGSFYQGLLPHLNDEDQAKLEAHMSALQEKQAEAGIADQIFYFTRDNCPYCVEIAPFLEEYQDERFVTIDLGDEDNRYLYLRMLELYGYPDGPDQPSTLVPAIFVNDAYLRGTQQIRDYLPQLDISQYKSLIPAELR